MTTLATRRADGSAAQGSVVRCAATLYVKNLPDELHAALRERAAREGLTLSDYVTRLVRRDLRRPALNQWLDGVAAQPVRAEVDVIALLDQVRDQL
jgi:plasmid stability protein